MILPLLLLALAVSTDVREALPTSRWTQEDVRTVVRAVLRDDRLDPAEVEMLQTLAQRKPYPPAPAPPEREARLLGLLVTRLDLPNEPWRTRVEVASLSPQTEGLVVGLTARALRDDPGRAETLRVATRDLPADLQPLATKILEDAEAQLQMESDHPQGP